MICGLLFRTCARYKLISRIIYTSLTFFENVPFRVREVRVDGPKFADPPERSGRAGLKSIKALIVSSHYSLQSLTARLLEWSLGQTVVCRPLYSV
jgi:hypothetical protein